MQELVRHNAAAWADVVPSPYRAACRPRPLRAIVCPAAERASHSGAMAQRAAAPVWSRGDPRCSPVQTCHRVRVWSQRLFAARADGKPSTLLDEASRRAYFMCTHIRPAVLSAIVAAGRADDVPDAAAALQGLTAVLVRHFDPLQRTFAHYAASEPGEASTMGAARRKSPHSHAARDPLGSRFGGGAEPKAHARTCRL